ncbi:nucleotidyltransferase domain-containing protein [Rhizobium alvei]|uniref:Nucleotidyltransferase domain-containing protein n=1 Tax=Rhizobium alvei TaxID=1132659 RepID=A0ABT8YNG5_9HYPH|nr:nucleotidyltransferase domain-containing protein [Rhizobium alvei]MDO6964913.1 nucleotidyltransferase domain-containing protein [Rhizobium alvei]
MKSDLIRSGFSAAALGEIEQRLEQVRADGVNLLFAIESGSRAWGFPSPDSDYDCRFVYIRPPEQHFVLQVQKDVIEFPIEGDIDVSGWDLRKALQLALKGNAVIAEWAHSPLVYRETPGFLATFRDLLNDIVPVELTAQHYIGLVRRHVPEDLSETKRKKLLYGLRPALALKYLEERNFNQLPPMDIAALLDGIEISADLRNEIHDLIEAKKVTREMGSGKVPDAIAQFIGMTIERYAAKPPGVSDHVRSKQMDRYRQAEEFYGRSVPSHGAHGE